MSTLDSVSFKALPTPTEHLKLDDLATDLFDEVRSLQVENTGLTKSISRDIGVEGPARNGTLTPENMLRSLEKSSLTSIHLHENLTKFSILSTTMTSFGNHLNSFLKGQ